MNVKNRDLDGLEEGGGTLDERSQSFIDDIMEGIPDPKSDPLLNFGTGSNGGFMSPSPIRQG